MNLTEKMTIADKFRLVSDHPWRAQHYELINSDLVDEMAFEKHGNDEGLVMVEMLAGKYQVCRIEKFAFRAHVDFDGDQVPESIDYQPKYYGEFSQLLQAFVKALQVSTTDLTTNTVGI